MPTWEPDTDQFRLAIDSIMEQKYSDLELLIIYKKSQNQIDNTIEHIIDENKDDHRLKFHISDEGYVQRLNEGIKMSKGKFIGRMDADDISTKDRFFEQMNYLREKNISILGSWVYSISSDGKLIGTIEPPVEHEEIRKKIMYHSPLSHSSILMQKNILNKIGLYDEKFIGAEDYELYLRAIFNGYRIENIPKYLIYIREHDTSYMRGGKWKSSRSAYFRAKSKAVTKYRFRNFSDIIFWSLTPITFLINPKMAYFMKKNVGWYKNNK